VAAPTAALAAPSPGSPGIGDPYYPDYGNGGYDVGHYSIDVGYQPRTGELTGTTTITATATQDLSRFDLDFLLPVSSATVNGQPARTREYVVDTPAHNYGGELVVTPAHPIRTGTAMTIVVTYAGNPARTKVNGFSPWFPTPSGAVIADEAEAAAWWFPSNDHPLDKATYDLAINVPAGLQAISNGVLVGQSTRGSTTTYRWRENKPMATYLAFTAIGKYDLTTGTTSSGLPYYFALADGTSAAAAADIARTPEVISWETTQWGPYPFDAIGGVVPDIDFGYALETQTKPTYSPEFWDGGSDIYVVVHENAHQWFGDSTSVHHWSDIWLNEGFASFTEWLWSEQHHQGTAEELFEQYYNGYGRNDPIWRVRVSDPGAAHVFSNAIYDRGAMTLQALRNRVGDPAFFQILRTWAATHRYGNGTVDQFEALAQRLSGQDLRDFFINWLDDPFKPAPTPENGFPRNFGTASTVPASLPLIRRADAATR
jgi:aminopeptidase N